MQKIVQKVGENGRAVMFSINRREIFSEDFKAMTRSMMLSNIVKAYNEGRLRDGSKEGEEDAMKGLLGDIISGVLESIPLLMTDCLNDLNNSDIYRKEMEDLGCVPPDTKDDGEKADI